MSRRYALLVVALVAGLALAGCMGPGDDGTAANDTNDSMEDDGAMDDGDAEQDGAMDGEDGDAEDGDAMEGDDGDGETDGAMENDTDTDGAMEDDGTETDGAMEDDGETDDGADDGDTADGDADDGGDAGSGSSSLSLDATLPALDQGVYQAWGTFGNETVSAGTFDAGDEPTFDVDRDLSQADAILVTIEPSPDDEGSSGIVVLNGSVEDGAADLAFPVDLSDASGSFILASETNRAEEEERSGVWFYSLPAQEPSLDLPTLGDGWSYEGWVVMQDTPITMGRFDDPTAPDDFDGYSGRYDGLGVPGEDFLADPPGDIAFPTDLTSFQSRVIVSVEPETDVELVHPGTMGDDYATPDGTPFPIQPLAGDVPRGAEEEENLPLERDLSDIPEGTATITAG